MMSGENILVVDDEVKIVEIVSNFLTMHGFSVKKTYDGQEALNVLLEGTPIDLILLDEKMPVMSGSTLLREMKKLKIDIPVIILTGSIALPQVLQSNKSLCEHVFVKPIRLSELLELVNKVLDSGTGKRSRGPEKENKRP
ncbi:MAG: response regulator [Candidatus Omnitrophota bacterium]|nr:response regulator [Candidatus Omnitrophota bacterium]